MADDLPWEQIHARTRDNLAASREILKDAATVTCRSRKLQEEVRQQEAARLPKPLPERKPSSEREPHPELEPLPGSVISQFICCGKPGCRCSHGDLHGPYYSRIWREDGRVRKQYVKITDVERVRKQTQMYEEYAAALKRLQRQRLALQASITRWYEDLWQIRQTQDPGRYLRMKRYDRKR